MLTLEQKIDVALNNITIVEWHSTMHENIVMGNTDEERVIFAIEREQSKDQIKTVQLIGTQLSNRCMRAFKNLPNLELLSLKDSSITNSGMNTLPSLINLKTLHFNNVQVTPKKLRNIADIPSDINVVLKNMDIPDDIKTYLKYRVRSIKFE